MTDEELEKIGFDSKLYKELKRSHRVLEYIDIYTFLIDKEMEYFELWIQTRKSEYRKQADKAAEMLTRVARKALNDPIIEGRSS